MDSNRPLFIPHNFDELYRKVGPIGPVPDSDSQLVPWLVGILRQVEPLVACNECRYLTELDDDDDYGDEDEAEWYRARWRYADTAEPLVEQMSR